MALINNIETVRANGVNVMFINDNSSIADITAAEERFLEPILGAVLYEILLDEVDVVNSDYLPLIKKAQKALAPLAYWLDLPHIQSTISDRGAGTFSSDNMQPLHRWEYESLRESLADKGCFALEKMLQHLFEEADFYEWTVPATHNTIIKTGTEFSSIVTLFQPYRTFENLRPLVKQTEDQYICNSIGASFFEALRDAATPTAEEAKAIVLIKKAVANLCIKSACEVLPVKIAPGGFTTQLSDANEKPEQGEATASSKQMGLLYTSVKQTGESYLGQLMEYLNTNASSSVFTAFFSSSYYTAPVAAEDVVNNNEDSKIFRM